MTGNCSNLYKTQIKILKAFHGDAIIIKTFDADNNTYNIVIDGGTARTFSEVLAAELKSLDKIDLLVLTHIDSDHISGLIKFIKSSQFNSNVVKKYWINSKNVDFFSSSDNIGYGQAVDFERLLIEKGEVPEKLTQDITAIKKFDLVNGIDVQILSPTKEVLEQLYENWPSLKKELKKSVTDLAISSSMVQSQILQGSLTELSKKEFKPDKRLVNDIINSSSIAFVLKLPDIKILLLADARPEIIINSLTMLGYSTTNKLKVDYVKISHHGSINNTSNALLDLIDCSNFIISTNGGSSTHKFPSRETLARIIHHPERVLGNYDRLLTIYFNYPLDNIERKSGKLICDQDLNFGNWRFIDNVNLLP